jgi:hypothetical protein
LSELAAATGHSFPFSVGKGELKRQDRTLADLQSTAAKEHLLAD